MTSKTMKSRTVKSRTVKSIRSLALASLVAGSSLLAGGGAAMAQAAPGVSVTPAAPGAPVTPAAPATPAGAVPALPSSAAAVLAELDASEPGTVRLTMQQVVDLATAQQANLRVARANAEASATRVELARVPLRPTISVGASLSTGSTGVRPCTDDPTQSCGGFFDASASTGLSAQASLRLYDFGQTAASIRAAEASAAASDASVKVTELDVRTGAELAYLEAVARHHLVLVAQATVESEQAHFDQAKRFVAAGARDPIEVAQAQSRVAAARSSLAQAQSNQAVALGNLRAAIGWVDPSRQVVTELTWPQGDGFGAGSAGAAPAGGGVTAAAGGGTSVAAGGGAGVAVAARTDAAVAAAQPMELIRLVENARLRRPEIVQLDKLIAASDANVSAAQASRRPTLSAFASTQWGPDSNDWTPQPSWSAGLQLSWNLFDGGRASAEIKIARANLRATVAQRDALLVSLTSGLETARARILANAANSEASTEAVTAAQAALRLAEARYAQGLGSQIEVADAQSAVTVAQGNLVVAEWQLADAWAQLRRAIGG
jgi:outer membrane protein TolC